MADTQSSLPKPHMGKVRGLPICAPVRMPIMFRISLSLFGNTALVSLCAIIYGDFSVPWTRTMRIRFPSFPSQ
jgi:hypothetical protein